MELQPFDLDRLRSSSLMRGVEYHAELGSTNDRAAELARLSPLNCPLLILAGRQNAGRGRGSNRWWSSAGALTFTLLLDASDMRLPIERWPQLALAAGVAVCEAIEQSIPQAAVGLKWPNDVYLDGKKVAGILIEVPTGGAGRLLVGIGVNVNNSLASGPPELAAAATSMNDIAGKSVDSTDLLLDILSRFKDWRSHLVDNEGLVFERWQKHCLLTGKRVCLNAGSRQVSGLCRGIDEKGRLLLSTSEGTQHYLSGTIVSFE